MKNENKSYAKDIINKMFNNLSVVVKVQDYSLDDLTISIKDLDNVKKEKVLEEVISNQLKDLKENATFDKIRQVFKQVDEITDYFIKYYDNDDDIVSECDDIANDLLFKTIGKNGRSINLPISISYIKDYCLSSNIKNEQIYDSLVWIALRLVAISYCINYNNVIEENEEQ